eukprot:scaffold64242_cov102-Phaeocystis_antarctica.AAC.1
MGCRPNWIKGARVVLQARAGTRTSSPGLKPRVPNVCNVPMFASSSAPATATRFADEPELTMTAHGTPREYDVCCRQDFSCLERVARQREPHRAGPDFGRLALPPLKLAHERALPLDIIPEVGAVYELTVDMLTRFPCRVMDRGSDSRGGPLTRARHDGKEGHKQDRAHGRVCARREVLGYFVANPLPTLG